MMMDAQLVLGVAGLVAPYAIAWLWLFVHGLFLLCVFA
jgi:hypothetical protein